MGTTGSSVADASVTINGNSANLGGDVGIGSITTVANTVKGTGNAYVAIADQNVGAQSGTLSVGGITTLVSESPQSGDTHVTLSNSNGGIDLTGFAISTDDSAATSSLNGDVSLTASGGGAINVSEITATNSAINASTLGGGNITLGELSPGTGSTDEFSSIDLESSGTLSCRRQQPSLSTRQHHSLLVRESEFRRAGRYQRCDQGHRRRRQRAAQRQRYHHRQQHHRRHRQRQYHLHQ